MAAIAILVAAALALPVAEVGVETDNKVKTYPGRVMPVQQVSVVPQVAGEILEVAFENGAVVKEGDLLYRLDQVKYEAAVKNGQAKVAECKANLSYAELSYERHKKLLETRAVSLDAVDNALSSRDSARAALAAAEADLIVARDNLRHCRITAPIAGKLGTTAYTKGNYVQTSSGTLVTLIQTSPIRVKFSISNGDFLEMFGARNRRIKEEGTVKLTLADGREFSENGEVEYVDNAADDLTDTVIVYALFKNEQRVLKPGGTVVVTLSSSKGVERPAVTPAAIMQDLRGSYVWVVGEGGKAERRYVVRGAPAGDKQFVLRGLNVGERIVSDGVHKVTAGDVITPAK